MTSPAFLVSWGVGGGIGASGALGVRMCSRPRLTVSWLTLNTNERIYLFDLDTLDETPGD